MQKVNMKIIEYMNTGTMYFIVVILIFPTMVSISVQFDQSNPIQQNNRIEHKSI